MSKIHPEIVRSVITRNRNFRNVIKQAAANLREAIPDIRCTIEEMVSKGDRVVTRWTLRGTEKGPNHKICTFLADEVLTVTGLNSSRIVTGKIREYQSYVMVEGFKIRSMQWSF